MANVYIKTVNGGEDTTPAGTDAIELDDGTTSRWALLSNLYKAIGSGTQDATTFLRGDGAYASPVWFTPGGRLTLTTATPVTTADVTGATSIYYTPYKHNQVGLWDGTQWLAITFTEKTLALGTITAALPYDVFGYLDTGALVLELLAWTNGTTRATAISLQDGRYCKTGDKTRLYLGTFYTTSTTETEDSGGFAHQSGGKRFLWNMYNRVWRSLGVIDTTDTWAYTTDTIRQANGAAGNKVEFIAGLAEDTVSAQVASSVSLISNSAKAAKVGVGLDATNAFNGLRQVCYYGAASTLQFAIGGAYSGIPGVGYHYLSWNEKGADGTCIFSGDGGGTGEQSGLNAEVWA